MEHATSAVHRTTGEPINDVLKCVAQAVEAGEKAQELQSELAELYKRHSRQSEDLLQACTLHVSVIHGQSLFAVSDAGTCPKPKSKDCGCFHRESALTFVLIV